MRVQTSMSKFRWYQCQSQVWFLPSLSWSSFQCRSLKLFDPGPDEVLIKLNVTGVCYSDLHFMLEDLGTPPMSTFGVRSPGHEGAGVIVKIGANVKNFKVGDRAGLKPIWDTCGNCQLCWGDKECYCPQAQHTGLMRTGSYQQYV